MRLVRDRELSVLLVWETAGAIRKKSLPRRYHVVSPVVFKPAEGGYVVNCRRLFLSAAVVACAAIVIQCGLVFESDLEEANSGGRVDHHAPGLLVGTWRLIETCDWAWGEGCTRVENSGRRDVITFAADGQYARVLGDTLSFTGSYRIVVKEDFRFNRPDTMVELDEKMDMAYSFHHRDTLTLGLVGFDAGTATYLRVHDEHR
jgi:hypothetical protein